MPRAKKHHKPRGGYRPGTAHHVKDPCGELRRSRTLSVTDDEYRAIRGTLEAMREAKVDALARRNDDDPYT